MIEKCVCKGWWDENGVDGDLECKVGCNIEGGLVCSIVSFKLHDFKINKEKFS